MSKTELTDLLGSSNRGDVPRDLEGSELLSARLKRAEPMLHLQHRLACFGREFAAVWVLLAISFAGMVVGLVLASIAFSNTQNTPAPVAPVPVPASPSPPVYTGQRVGFGVVLDTTTPIGTGATTQLIGWSSNNGAYGYSGLYNAGDFNEVSGTYVVPATAVYQLNFYAFIDYSAPVASAETSMTCTFAANATPIATANGFMIVQSGQVARPLLSMSKMVVLTAGQSVTVSCQNSNSGLTGTFSAGLPTTFSIERVAF